MANLTVVDDTTAPFQECAACGYTWIDHDPTCPSCAHFGPPTNPLPALLIDWPEFWARDPATEDWLVWPLVPRGRGVALYAPAKAGKSLVVLALCAAASIGVIGLDGVRRPLVHILYLDYEMTLDDLQERLEEMGYGPNSDLSHLHYASLPSLPPLNSPEGAKALMTLVEACGAELVVIDTFGRSVTGKENDNDTAMEFYRWTGLTLKAAQVAFLRTDHSGKDVDRGQRGGSAKVDDVDIVWRLTRTQTGVALKATHRRISWVPEDINITVDDGDGWRFELATDDAYPEGTKALAELLDHLGVHLGDSFKVANNMIKAADPDGKGRRRGVVMAAQRWRQAALPTFTQPVDNSACPVDKPVETVPGTALHDYASEPTPEPQSGNGYLAGTEPHPEPSGTASPGHMGTGFPPLRGNRYQSPPDYDPEEPF